MPAYRFYDLTRPDPEEIGHGAFFSDGAGPGGIEVWQELCAPVSAPQRDQGRHRRVVPGGREVTGPRQRRARREEIARRERRRIHRIETQAAQFSHAALQILRQAAAGRRHDA